MNRGAALLMGLLGGCEADPAPESFAGTLRQVDDPAGIANIPVWSVTRDGEIFAETDTNDEGRFDVEVPPLEYFAVVAEFDEVQTATTGFGLRADPTDGDVEVYDRASLAQWRQQFATCAHLTDRQGAIDAKPALLDPHLSDVELDEWDNLERIPHRLEVDATTASCIAPNGVWTQQIGIFGVQAGWQHFDVTIARGPHAGATARFLAFVPRGGVARFEPAVILTE